MRNILNKLWNWKSKTISVGLALIVSWIACLKIGFVLKKYNSITNLPNSCFVDSMIYASRCNLLLISSSDTWNSVYGNIDVYKQKLGDNFIMYQSPAGEYENEVKEFNEAVKQGKLYEWLEELTSKNPDQFRTTLGNKAPSPEPTTPEEQAKKEKAKEKAKEAYKLQVEQLEREFLNIDNKIKNIVLTEQEIIQKVKEFV